jgi:hypothetical protein
VQATEVYRRSAVMPGESSFALLRTMTPCFGGCIGAALHPLLVQHQAQGKVLFQIQ